MLDYSNWGCAIAFCRGFSTPMAGAMRILANHVKYDIALFIGGLCSYFKRIYI
jgi:hypothetical protein